MKNLAIGLLLVAATADAAPKTRFKAFPFATQQKSLPNGLRVVLVPYDSPGLAAYFTLVRVGSRNEAEPGRSGYAHFFEHMMFRGTKAHSQEEYNTTISKLGLNTNAFTSDDMTVYHLYGPSKALPTIVEYEADRFRNLDYSEAQFKTEAGAILGEYAKSASVPELKLREKMAETAFSQHTYRHTTLGYLEDIKNMPGGFEYSREFFRRYYTPDNTTLVIVGDFDAKKTLALVEKHYGGWAGKLDAVKIPVEPLQKEPRRAHVEWAVPTLPRVWLAWHAPSSSEIKSAALQNVLAGYLFGPTSPLYQDLMLERQIADGVDASYFDHRDPHLFGVLVRAKKADDVTTVEQAVLAQVKELAAGKVDRERLEAVRSNLKYSVVMKLDTADRVARALAVTTAQTGDSEFLNQLFATVDALREGELAAFAKQWLVDSNRTTVTLAAKGAK